MKSHVEKLRRRAVEKQIRVLLFIQVAHGKVLRHGWVK
jgi:hypothetical protein